MSGTQANRKRPFAAMAGDSADPLSQAFRAKHFFTTGKFSDFIISCNGKQWNVHKFQLCTASEYFERLCLSKFKESAENKIDLDDEDPDVVEAILSWIYNTGGYVYPADEIRPDEAASAESPETSERVAIGDTRSSDELFEVLMFTAADQYMIEPLKKQAVVSFEEACERGWATDSFPPAIAQVYSYASDRHGPLKDVILTTIIRHVYELLQDSVRYAAFHTVMRANADFSTDVTLALSKKQPKEVIVTKTVEKPVVHTVEKQVPDPTLRVFKCPTCSWRFAVGPGPSPTTHFSCPLGCWFSKTKPPDWWADYKAL